MTGGLGRPPWAGAWACLERGGKHSVGKGGQCPRGDQKGQGALLGTQVTRKDHHRRLTPMSPWSPGVRAAAGAGAQLRF